MTFHNAAHSWQVLVTNYNSIKAQQYLWHESAADPANNYTLVTDVNGNTIQDANYVDIQVQNYKKLQHDVCAVTSLHDMVFT